MAVTTQLNHFIPEIWAARLLEAVKTTHVGAAICNRDYEGEIANYGDTVKITDIGDPDVVDYTGQDMVFQEITDGNRDLKIDVAKAVPLQFDDVDRAQARDGGAALAQAVDRAAYKLADHLDRYVLDLMATYATTQKAKVVLSDPADAYDSIVDWGVALTKLDVPRFGRWAVVTPEFYGLMEKDARFIATGAAAADERLLNGIVGRANGVTIYVSNNLPDGALSTGATVKSVLLGTTAATTLAEQIAKSETARAEKSFKDLVKFLHVYGAKVVRPDFLVSADVVVA
jgi:hypothetical protein